MKKINLKGISEILSEKELKNVMGGSNGCSPSLGVSACLSVGNCWAFGQPGYCGSVFTGNGIERLCGCIAG